MLWKAKRAQKNEEIRDELDFSLARESDEVLDELLTQLDYSEEYEAIMGKPEWAALLVDSVINDKTFSSVIKYLIKTDESYAKRHKVELIQEYRLFNF